MSEVRENTPYTLLGGDEAVRRLVDRFYDLMDADPELRELRAMHATDLTPMRQKLFEFMSGWLGGPPLYFARPDSACIVSAHRPFKIGAKEKDQWLSAMFRSLAETNLDQHTRDLIQQALNRMAEAFRNQ
jgi:hemoglobin